MRIIKYLTVILSFLLWLSGLAMILIGAILMGASAEVGYSDDKFVEAASFLTAFGIVIFTIGFLGWFGAITESHRLITIFTVVSMVILLAEIGAVVLGFAYREDDEPNIAPELKTLDWATGPSVFFRLTHRFPFVPKILQFLGLSPFIGAITSTGFAFLQILNVIFASIFAWCFTNRTPGFQYENFSHLKENGCRQEKRAPLMTIPHV